MSSVVNPRDIGLVVVLHQASHHRIVDIPQLGDSPSRRAVDDSLRRCGRLDQVVRPRLTRLAIEHGVGVRAVVTWIYKLRRQAGRMSQFDIKIERKDKRYNNTYVILDKKPTKLKRKKVA